MRRKGILMTLLFLWVYLVGMGILPLSGDQQLLHRQANGKLCESFHGTSPTESGTDSTEATQAAQKTEPPTPYPELLEMLEAYNRELYEDDQSKLSSLAATEQPGVLFSVSGQTGDVFGVLSIPKLEMEMPLYLGATEAHMAEGAAQLGQTSIPIGGENTNAVIARTPGLQWCALLPLCAGIAGWGFRGHYQPLGHPALQRGRNQNHPAQ